MSHAEIEQHCPSLIQEKNSVNSLQDQTKMTSFDDVLERVGPCGKFQITLFMLMSLTEVALAWAMFQPVFVAMTPNWTCESLAEYNNTSNSSWIWDNHPSFHNLCELVQNKSCGRIIFYGEYSTVVSEWKLVCDKEYLRTLAMTVQMVGVLIGALVCGQLADMIGRRYVFFIDYSLLVVISLATSFVNSWELYAVCRFAVGVLIGGAQLIGFVIPVEFVGKRWRTLSGCTGLWACGIMSLAAIAYLLNSWRHVMITCSLLSIPPVFSYWYVPESPRWLIEKSRLMEAHAVLENIRIINNRDCNIDLDIRRMNNQGLKEDEATFKQCKRYAFWSLFSSLKLARNTVILSYAWFTCAVVYYGTSLNVGDLFGNRHVNFFVCGLVELPALYVVIFTNNRFGRRKTTALFILTAGVSCVAVVLADVTGRTDQYVITILAMIGKSGVAGAWSAVQVFSAEVFPTVIRNIGVGTSAVSGRIGGIVAPQLLALSVYFKSLPFIVFGLAGVTSAFLCFLLPETNNLALSDAIERRKNGCTTNDGLPSNKLEHVSTKTTLVATDE